MMSYLLEAAVEMLRMQFNVQEYGIQACSDPEPFPTSPDIYFAVHEAGFTNERSFSDALAMRLRFRVTISVRTPEWPEDRQDSFFSEQTRNVLKIAEKVGWILHQERWNVMAMANDRRPQNMNGLAEPYGLIDLGENAKRNGKWWQLSDGGNELTGFSRSVLFGGALWQAAQEQEPDPSEILQ
jgi:hypothetical protein